MQHISVDTIGTIVIGNVSVFVYPINSYDMIILFSKLNGYCLLYHNKTIRWRRIVQRNNKLFYYIMKECLPITDIQCNEDVYDLLDLISAVPTVMRMDYANREITKNIPQTILSLKIYDKICPGTRIPDNVSTLYLGCVRAEKIDLSISAPNVSTVICCKECEFELVVGSNVRHLVILSERVRIRRVDGLDALVLYSSDSLVGDALVRMRNVRVLCVRYYTDKDIRAFYDPFTQFTALYDSYNRIGFYYGDISALLSLPVPMIRIVLRNVTYK